MAPEYGRYIVEYVERQRLKEMGFVSDFRGKSSRHLAILMFIGSEFDRIAEEAMRSNSNG